MMNVIKNFGSLKDFRSLKLLFIQRMFHLACHECFRVLLEGAQAGAGAEIDPIPSINGAGIPCGIVQVTTAGS